MRLMSRRRYSMKAAKSSEISPIVTISGPGASAAGIEREQHLEAQQRIERDVQAAGPDSTAEIGVGPSAWASGSQACSGARPTLVP